MVRKIGLLLSCYFIFGVTSIAFIYTDAEARTGADEYYYLLQAMGIILGTTMVVFIILQMKNKLVVRSLAFWGNGFSLLFLLGTSFYISDRPIYTHEESLTLVENTYTIEVTKGSRSLIEDLATGRVNYYHSDLNGKSHYIVNSYTGVITVTE